MLQIVYAYCASKNVENETEYAFGLNGGLPWGHIPQDLKNFKARTENTVLVMGAKTYMSLPSPLKGRKTIVVQDLSRGLAQAKDGLFADFYTDIEQFREMLKGGDFISWDPSENKFKCDKFNHALSVVGGAGLIQEAAPFADKIIKTSIHKRHRVNSDVQLPMGFIVFPSWEGSGFETKENHWWKLDELTSITEIVYERVSN